MKCMPLIFLCLLVVIVLGCRRDYEFPESLRADFMSIPEKIRNPEGVDPLAYANLLLNRVIALQDRKVQLRVRKEWEALTYRVLVNAKDLRLRYNQHRVFYEVAGLAAACILKIGGTEEEFWESSIRLHKWEQRQIENLGARPVLAPNDHRPRSREEIAREVYWDFFHDLHDSHVRQLEHCFNVYTCGSVSVERQQNIRKRIESVIGRRIRSEDEILAQHRRRREILRQKEEVRKGMDHEIQVKFEE